MKVAYLEIGYWILDIGLENWTWKLDIEYCQSQGDVVEFPCPFKVLDVKAGFFDLVELRHYLGFKELL